MWVETLLIWKNSLSELLQFYEDYRYRKNYFLLKLFIFFIVINIFCYWWALAAVFPEVAFGAERAHYFKLQFPVGLLGALFDSLSFFVTVGLIRNAVKARSNLQQVGHLSIDFLIAVLASLWVVFVFSFSGWLISLLESQPESLVRRSQNYSNAVVEAVANPTQNFRNIYFGLVMGVSAMIPTTIHVVMACRSLLKAVKQSKS